MPSIKCIVLDVLKPHRPNVLEFARKLAELSADYQVEIRVVEVDDKTESTVIKIEGKAVDMPQIEKVITGMGGSVHSIDEVRVSGESPAS